MECKNYAIPEHLFYDTNDFWVKVIDGEAVVGMTDYGQSNIGDILYLELLPSGAACRRGEIFGSIESGKWVGNLTSPLSGEIIASNPEVERNPRRVNADAYCTGWLYRISLSNPDEVKELMSALEYSVWVLEQINSEDRIG